MGSLINSNDLDVIGKKFFHSSREIDIEMNLKSDGSSEVDMSDDIVARNDGDNERNVPANELEVHRQDIRCNRQSFCSNVVGMSDDIVARNEGDNERNVPANKQKGHGKDIRCNH